jgi:hypothetical protein
MDRGSLTLIGGAMLTQKIRIGILFSSILLISGCGTGGMEDFSPDGKFKVSMPGNPMDNTRPVDGTIIKSWIIDEGSSGFGVSVIDLGEEIPQDQIDQRLDLIAQDQAGGLDGQMNGKSATTLAGKYKGVSTEGTSRKIGIYKSRIYLVKTNVYQLLVMGKESRVNSADATKFLDSLQIISE